jgi:hypothetical protein
MKKIPNCKICLWKENLVNHNPKIKATRPGCSAQASQDCANVYSTRECKKLYQINQIKKIEKL